MERKNLLKKPKKYYITVTLNMMNKITIYLIILFYAFNIKAQNNKPILFLGATTHIGNGKKFKILLLVL